MLLVACDRPPLEGASRMGPGIYWKLHTLGEGARFPTDSDSVFVSVRIGPLDGTPGSTFSTEQWYAMGGGLDDLLERMRSGDSVTVASTTAALPWEAFGAVAPDQDPGPDTWYATHLVMRRIRSLAESRESQATLLAARTSSDEDSTLARYLRTAPGPWKLLKNVHYQVDGAKGHGPLGRYKEQVSVNCTTYLLGSDRPVDDTRWGGQPLTWRLGDPGQVVEGVELAVQVLRVGDKGRFIVPSTMAFGPQGTRSGMIPPWTPVLFEVERLPTSAPEPAALP